MDNPLISVIIPVYNIEKYVRKCVESVMAQTYKNLEILLIDDGSTDGGGAVCDELARSDGRIRVFHTANAGASAARNLGIKESKSEYIAFVDGDDYVTADYISTLYNLLQEHSADISITSHLVQYDGMVCPEGKKIVPCTFVMDRLEALEAQLYEKHFLPIVWARLFRRSLFNEVEFPVGKTSEDVGILYKLFDKAERVVYSSAANYIYLQRLGSVEHPRQRDAINKHVENYIILSEEMRRYILHKYPNLTEAVTAKCFHANLMCLKKIRFIDIYRGELTYIRANILKYRKHVLVNPKPLLKHKISAALSYLGIWVLKIVLAVFDFFRARKYGVRT